MTDLAAAARVLGVDSPAHPLESDVEYLSLVARGFPVKALFPKRSSHADRFGVGSSGTDLEVRGGSALLSRPTPSGFGQPQANRSGAGE